MDMLINEVSIATLMTHIIAFIYFSYKCPTGAASMPCIMILVSAVYFFYLPCSYVLKGGGAFHGMYFENFEKTHLAVFLYLSGAICAFILNWKYINTEVNEKISNMGYISRFRYNSLWILALVAVIAQVTTGKIEIGIYDESILSRDKYDYKFTNLFITSLVPLSLILLIKRNFDIRSILICGAVMAVCIQIGARSRILLLIFSAITAYAIINKTHVKMLVVLVGAALAIMFSNAIALARTYGSGVNVERLNGVGVIDLLTDPKGEIGPVYVLYYVTSSDKYNMSYFEPWTTAIARLVPKFLWQEKPDADYLSTMIAGFSEHSAIVAGIAPTQHAEIMVQFGWIGLPILAFIYFSIAARLNWKLGQLGREAQIAGLALVPVFFGFSMQHRGYFFQAFTTAIFLFGPLFIINKKR